MTVGMHVTMVMSVAVGVGRGHGKTLYYNITSVHRLVCNCQHCSSARPPRKMIDRTCCFARRSPVLAPLRHARMRAVSSLTGARGMP
jgi:hypothetical protein